MTTGEFGKLGAAVAAILTIGLPVGLWAAVLRPWRPKSRLTHALRFSLWPPVVLSFDLGVPLTLYLFGAHATYGKSLGETLLFVSKASIVPAAICFALGWWRGKAVRDAERPPEALV